MATQRIATIIPFYQRDPGILRKAMTGIYDQILPAGVSVHVFIIDDSSPLSPEGDLADLPERDDITVSVLRQPNAGPGGARNKGLDLATEGGFDFVAFLDSDDVWASTHLAEALDAMAKGYGFYFCDNSRDGWHESYFKNVKCLRDEGAALAAKSTLLSAEGPVKGFEPGALVGEMVAEYLCQTSCVVARTEVFSNRRFDGEQRAAGEDYLYWISVALDGPAMAVSWKCNVTCGKGVNVFFSAYDWNSPKTLERVGHLLLLAEKLKRWPVAMRLGRVPVDSMHQRYRRAYGYLFLRTLLRGRKPSTDSLRKLLRLDPLLPFRMPFLFMRVAVDHSVETRSW